MTNPNIHPIRFGGGHKWLIYGHPGRQKTRFIGSCGAMGKTLILRPPTDSPVSIVGWPNVFEWVIEDHGALDDAYREVRGSKEWKWVWLDSISLWQDTGLDDIWDTVITERPQRARYGLDKGEYGINAFRIGQWVRNMTACADEGNFNFGITAHPRELNPFEDGEGREMMMPWIQTRNMAPKVCGYMHIVGYLDLTKQGSPCLYTRESQRYYAKNQWFSLGEKGSLIAPTAAKLDKSIREKIKSNGQLAKPVARRRRVVRRAK